MVYFCLVVPRKGVVPAAVLAAALYAGLWIGVAAHWPWLTAVDTVTLHRFHDFGINHPAWIDAWRVPSEVFGPSVLRVVGVLVIVVALLRRQFRIAGFVAMTVLPAGLLTASAKALSDRPRPETALIEAASSSFPSGHALGIMVGVLVLGTLLWERVAPAMRVPMIAVGAALVFTVGLSRVVLNVHHPSDVVAGWALGLLFYLVCLVLVPPRVAPFSAF